jgi:hypothetical protein
LLSGIFSPIEKASCAKSFILTSALPEVNSLWLNFQLLIALHSPYAVLETGLRMCPAEKSRDSDLVVTLGVRSLQSGLLRNYREKWASFAYFEGKSFGVSLHS